MHGSLLANWRHTPGSCTRNWQTFESLNQPVHRETRRYDVIRTLTIHTSVHALSRTVQEPLSSPVSFLTRASLSSSRASSACAFLHTSKPQTQAKGLNRYMRGQHRGATAVWVAAEHMTWYVCGARVESTHLCCSTQTCSSIAMALTPTIAPAHAPTIACGSRTG